MKELGEVVIVVPSQGANVHHFRNSARALKSHLYPKAVIVETNVKESDDRSLVTFKTIDGAPFSWSTKKSIARVVVISHGGYDGPNLSYHGGGLQPWQFVRDDKNSPGNVFWGAVGASLSEQGSVILIGCHEGATPFDGSSYGQEVARITNRPVFAPSDFFAAAKSEVVVNHVRHIESGKALKPMKRF